MWVLVGHSCSRKVLILNLAEVFNEAVAEIISTEMSPVEWNIARIDEYAP